MNKQRHIVVADDEPQVRQLFTEILTKAGYDVTPVSSGSAAFGVLSEKTVDLLVLDLSMPEPDGFEVLKKLRVQRPGLRILVISGFMQGALLKASELLGATVSLSKIEAPQSLLRTVDMLLQ